jgi:hypothetical protein
MLNSRRTRLFAFALFASSIAFPPGWVLCMEPTGEVRVESAGIACCADEAAPSGDRAVTAPGPDDCDGCRDVAVSQSALRSTRSAADSPHAVPSPALVPARWLAPAHSVRGRYRVTPLPRHPALAGVATTVLLR